MKALLIATIFTIGSLAFAGGDAENCSKHSSVDRKDKAQADRTLSALFEKGTYEPSTDQNQQSKTETVD